VALVDMIFFYLKSFKTLLNDPVSNASDCFRYLVHFTV